MTDIPDSHRGLLQEEVATLATNGPDGRPQVSEVWFLDEDGTIAISLNTARQKSKNLERDPRCTVFLLDRTNPYRYLEIRGDAELFPDDEYELADRVGAKYGADLRAHDRPGERRIAVRIRPARVNAVDMSAS